ncbi:MAG: hypothetical protein KGJ80_08485, partial [Chloroflexota bacterium]|nr:hypothetical protein [Chloroflexota bacterium]
HEELQDLREVIAEMRGKPYTRKASIVAKTNVRALHPRGAARFKSDDSKSRMLEANAAGSTFVAAMRDSMGADQDAS